MMPKTKKIVKITAITLVSIIVLMIVLVGGYMAYVAIDYKRVDDNLSLDVNNPQSGIINANETFIISTFNIGFGAYSQDFSFFMDSGTMKNGEKVSGKYAKAKNKETVVENTNGAVEASKLFNADFMFFQEVDIKSTRSHNVNQFDALNQAFANYSNTFSQNFDSAYLLYPFNDPIGKSNSGIVTYSKYKIDDATRISLPLSQGFSKFFDLDRCISVFRLPISNGKELVLINAHLSAYDEGGTIREQQFNLLSSLLNDEYKKGNYVIAGGDFNHDIANSSSIFQSEQLKPEWVYDLSNDDLPNGFSFAAATNAPTCRSTDLPYTKGVNYTVVIDGFIISDNINVANIANIDLDFKNSDHNPVVLNFSFN